MGKVTVQSQTETTVWWCRFKEMIGKKILTMRFMMNPRIKQHRFDKRVVLCNPN